MKEYAVYLSTTIDTVITREAFSEREARGLASDDWAFDLLERLSGNDVIGLISIDEVELTSS